MAQGVLTADQLDAGWHHTSLILWGTTKRTCLTSTCFDRFPDTAE
jgi:hypothetical protein